MVKPINWKEYDDTFPMRYISDNKLDHVVHDFVQRLDRRIQVLDVGGGVRGTRALNSPNVDAYILDPFVEGPEWVAGRARWETIADHFFDLAVARCSLSELGPFEVYQISKCADRFIANIFINSPFIEWRERPYTTRRGTTGIEKAKFDKETGLVTHVLMPEGKEPIRHQFYHHPPEKIQEYMPEKELTFCRYKRNSALVMYGDFS